MACCSAEEDPGTLSQRVSTFVSDRSVGAVTGPRRMPREDFVRFVADAAADAGLKVSVEPDGEVRGADVLVFMHWKEVDDAAVAANPQADVLCGQDLCHQVPAVMRLNRMDKR